MGEIVFLVDCNSFFVSCELIFRPELRGKPVIVASSNDGCVVARSNEAKKIGIAMGAPIFTIESLIKGYNVTLFSSNFPLYNDISIRVMASLRRFGEVMEVYSVDEAFLTFNSLEQPELLAKKIRKAIYKEVGIPVSIGIGTTKTLAKIANIAAKNDREGVFSLLDSKRLETALKKLPIVEIWGIGQRLAPRLQNYGIFTAWDLRTMDRVKLQRLFGIVVVKTALELEGTPSFSVEEIPKFPKSITSSRSFGTPTSELSLLNEALSSYIVRAAEKLYHVGGVAGGMIVSVATSRFIEPAYSNTIFIPLQEQTYYPPTLIEKGLEGLSQLFRPNYLYKKVGVTLIDLAPTAEHQFTFFQDSQGLCKKQKGLVEAVHQIKKRFGGEAVQYAAEGIQKQWRAKNGQRSPHYTTAWGEILTIQL
ncbi:MAG: Y-family DNA polymerase [Chlamydiia bacterium]